VLLQNEGDLLPLDPATLRRVAVIGPTADDQRLLQGDYSYPTHLELVYEGTGAPGVLPVGTTSSGGEQYLPAEGGAFAPGPHFVHHVTPLAGLRAALPGVEVGYAQGCDVPATTPPASPTPHGSRRRPTSRSSSWGAAPG
jgi:beta-glucosidase